MTQKSKNGVESSRFPPRPVSGDRAPVLYSPCSSFLERGPTRGGRGMTQLAVALPITLWPFRPASGPLLHSTPHVSLCGRHCFQISIFPPRRDRKIETRQRATIPTRCASEVMSRCLHPPPRLDRPPGIFLSLYLSVEFFVPSSVAGLLRNPTVVRQIKLCDLITPLCLPPATNSHPRHRPDWTPIPLPVPADSN